MMSARLIVAIISSLMEEIAIVVIALWGLPRMGIHLSVWGLIAIMLLWSVISVTIYCIGSRALKKKPVVGLPTMIGGRAKVVKPMAPYGMVSIKGELWEAASTDIEIEVGEEVTVIGQDGLKLIVRKNSNNPKMIE